MSDLKDEFEKDYIPKSKVREKIEEAKKLANELNWSHFDMSEEASKEYIKAIETVLSELEKKDKIIDLMAEWIENYTNYYDEDGCYCEVEKDICNKNIECDNCIKQYFEEKVEEDNLC